MNNVLAIIILIAEILTVLECLQIAFMQELKFDKYMVGIIVIDILIYTAINMQIIPTICSVVFYILVFIYCYCRFQQRLIKTTICFIIGVSLAGCIEAIMACGTNLFKDLLDSCFRLSLSSVLALLLAYVIKKCIPLLKLKKIEKNNKWMFYCVLFYGLAYGGLVVDYYLNQTFIKVYAVFILTFVVVIFYYLYKLVQAQAEINIKNHELELQRIYGGVYENLLGEVRRKQHDYKNQLGAIFSMHMAAHSIDELVNMQKEYIDTLQLNRKYDSILTCCNNPILAGYIYYRCLSCEKVGITVDYNIAINQAECCFPLYEIIEMLGILIDNACENVVIEKVTGKSIRFEFLEDDDKIKFSVSNPAKYFTCSEIDRMFMDGYSSKGENRGLGLARSLELVRKYKSEIKVQNILYKENNWIEFGVEIAK